jgi:hypothetical protein
MAVYHTKRNMVAAYEPEPQDRWVKTVIGTRCLLVQHIDQYQQAVDWAVSMADQFDPPLHILPFDVNDMVKLNRHRLERGLASITPEERHQLRQAVVATCAEIMRDCDDPAIRAEAHEVLVKMRAVQQ